MGQALWIDNLDIRDPEDREADRATPLSGRALGGDGYTNAVLQVFKPWLEDADRRKCFHNFAFDYHELLNIGIRVEGLSGDTIHMARLWDTSRLKHVGFTGGGGAAIDKRKQFGGAGYSLEALSHDFLGPEFHKVPMKDLFRFRGANQVPGERTAKTPRFPALLKNIRVLQPVEILQSTFFRLSALHWHSYGPDPHSRAVLCNS